MSDRALACRAPDDIHERVDAAAARAGVNKSAWLLEAITWALETDETGTRDQAKPTTPHVPSVIRAAIPKRIGSRMRMPTGRTFDRQ